MVIVAVNVPVEVVVMLAGTVATAVASNFVVMLLLGLNPEPVTVTTVPPIPTLGDSVIVAVVAAVVRLNAAEAALPDESAAVIV